ncbi:hypothetical protein DR950_18115 [Kitasatospora xanthocidica]|uniref:Lipoprotein n=1 Tax=Kitasatospora xanthocidica TaxID=83382 RepID=A0A372ZVD3_9ACTN|nr:hypothetical protein [Kitasatospora xanthocidica]RGD59454.1 hypothetical protein DR950_18115 [Kitasatospora xanthocidica]
MNMGGARLVAAAAVVAALGGLSACTSSGPASQTTEATSTMRSVLAAEGTPEWAAKWLGDRELNRNASRVVGRYAQLAIVQRGDRQGDAKLCDAEWEKFTAAQRVMVDRQGFDDGCRTPA